MPTEAYPMAEGEPRIPGTMALVIPTGETRPPKRGEWYLLGNPLEGRFAEKDFISHHAIATPMLTAALYRAAPDLLATCEQARAALPDAWFAADCGVPRELIDKLNAAIARATGETPA